jgi:hypothetical protein
VADLLAVAAVAALALALSRGSSGSDPLPVLLAPLCCLAAGVLTFRGAAVLLSASERVTRRGPVLTRLALVNLARSPGGPALAIAFIAVSIGLGGFALAYRATLLRGNADQAADRVPVDAIVAPSSDFTTPLQLASSARWQALAGGPVAPVRRTDAAYDAGTGAVTVPALGVPADALPRLHGWRTSDGSAPLAQLARRLVPPGHARTAGPRLPTRAKSLSLQVASRGIAVTVVADLRASDGSVHRVTMTGSDATHLHATVPSGSWELQALELQEPTGLEATNGHQNGENVAAATRFATTVRLGALRVLASGGQLAQTVPLASWRGVGAASKLGANGTGGLAVRFAVRGVPGIVRPVQPSDSRPVPVLVDPQTAVIAGRAGSLAVSVDGQPVGVRVVGTLKRFPTLASNASGFVIADQATLSSALDAQLPGQGRPDELWLTVSRPGALRSALRSGPLAALNGSFRADIERQLGAEPVARGVLGVLIAAAALAAALAAIGLLIALLGSAREETVERDLVAQGVGPRGLRRELRTRMLLAAVLGTVVGVVLAAILTTLAVGGVRSAGIVTAPRPALVTVTPWVELALWSVGAIAVFAALSWLATRTLTQKGRVA